MQFNLFFRDDTDNTNLNNLSNDAESNELSRSLRKHGVDNIERNVWNILPTHVFMVTLRKSFQSFQSHKSFSKHVCVACFKQEIRGTKITRECLNMLGCVKVALNQFPVTDKRRCLAGLAAHILLLLTRHTHSRASMGLVWKLVPRGHHT